MPPTRPSNSPTPLPPSEQRFTWQVLCSLTFCQNPRQKNCKIDPIKVKAVLTITLLLLTCALHPAHAAAHYDISDPFMAEYEGFWTAKNGAKGRLTAQIRPLSNNRYDGFILFVRAKTPVTAIQLTAAPEEK